MGVFHVFKIVRVVPNRAKHHKYQVLLYLWLIQLARKNSKLQKCFVTNCSSLLRFLMEIFICKNFGFGRQLKIGLEKVILCLIFFQQFFSIFCNTLVIRRKAKSQNGCYKKTKHVKFCKKRTFPIT